MISGISNGTTGSSTATSSLSNASTDFLAILSQQLKNQDPLNPMDSAEMTGIMAQVSQASSLDSMLNVLTSLTSMLGASALGKDALIPFSGNVKTSDSQKIVLSADQLSSTTFNGTPASTLPYDTYGKYAVFSVEAGTTVSGSSWNVLDKIVSFDASKNSYVSMTGTEMSAQDLILINTN